jgi:PAS domain S-box-containing protein
MARPPRTPEDDSRDEGEGAQPEERELFRLIIDSAKEYAIFTTDRRGRVLTWNAGAERLTGYRAEEIVGRDAGLIFTEDDQHRGAPEDELATAESRGRAEDERWHRRKDGSRFWGSGILMPIRDGAAFVKILRDNTERKRAEDELTRVRDELEARVQERTAELSQALITLEAEVSERKQAEQSRRELLRQLVTVQEDERRRISRELHDEMGQHLAALTLELHIIEGALPEDSSARGRLLRSRELISRLGQEVHRLALELRPTALDDLGLMATLSNYLDEWSARAGIRVGFHGRGMDGGRVPAHLETTIYRIVQEALTNVLKHAEASSVGVILERHQRSLHLIVEDNGRGFDVEAVMDAPGAGGRIGLVGMKERITMVGGTLSVESSLGGTTVFVRIPTDGSTHHDP